MESNQISFSDVIKMLKSNYKNILGYSILTSIIVAGLSLLLPDYYKSNVIFYVNNSENLNPKIFFSGETADFFGADEEIERIKLLSKSKEFQNKIINDFNLIEYFNIDTSTVKKRSKIYKKVNDILELTKDESETLILEVEHKNPEIAANIANKAVIFLEKLNSKIISSFLKEQEKMLNLQIIKLDNDLKSINSKVETIKNKYHISIKNMDMEDRLIGYTSESKEHQNDFDKGIDQFIVNRENYLTTSENKNEIENLFLQYNTIIKSINSDEIKSFTIVEKAYPNYIKDNPKRSFIVIGVFIFSILTFTLLLGSNRSKN